MLYFWCWNKTFLFTFLTLLQSIECWVLTLPHFSANKLLLTTWNSRSMTETHLNRHSQHCFIRQLLWPNDGSFISVLQQSPEKVPEDEGASVGESEVGVLRQCWDRKAPHLRSLIVNKSLSNFMTLWQCENTHQLTEVLIRGVGEVHQRRDGDIPGVLILLFLSRGLLLYLQLDDAAQVQGRLLLGGEVLGVLMDVLMYEVRVITAEKGHVLTGDQQRASCFLHEVTTFHWSLELQPWTSNGYKISEIKTTTHDDLPVVILGPFRWWVNHRIVGLHLKLFNEICTQNLPPSHHYWHILMPHLRRHRVIPPDQSFFPHLYYNLNNFKCNVICLSENICEATQEIKRMLYAFYCIMHHPGLNFSIKFKHL